MWHTHKSFGNAYMFLTIVIVMSWSLNKLLHFLRLKVDHRYIFPGKVRIIFIEFNDLIDNLYEHCDKYIILYLFIYPPFCLLLATQLANYIEFWSRSSPSFAWHQLYSRAQEKVKRYLNLKEEVYRLFSILFFPQRDSS